MTPIPTSRDQATEKKKKWGGGGGGGNSNKPLSLTDVKEWLDKQQPFVLQSVLKHSRELLTKKHNVPVEDMSDWYGDEDTDKNQVITKSGESEVVAYLWLIFINL